MPFSGVVNHHRASDRHSEGKCGSHRSAGGSPQTLFQQPANPRLDLAAAAFRRNLDFIISISGRRSAAERSGCRKQPAGEPFARRVSGEADEWGMV